MNDDLDGLIEVTSIWCSREAQLRTYCVVIMPAPYSYLTYLASFSKVTPGAR